MKDIRFFEDSRYLADKEKIMPVIVLASSKGGVGKSTIALTLAQVFAQSGADTTLIDADPNSPMTAWQNKTQKPVKHLTLVANVTEESMVDAIDEATSQSAFVVVDLEGTANLSMSYALGRADLALIPIQGSQLDANEAGKVLKLIERQERHLQRQINRSVIISRAPFIVPRTAKHIRSLISDLGVNILPAQLHERDAFRAVFSFGGTIYELTDDEVSKPRNAVSNAEDVAKSIVDLIRENGSA